MLLSVLPHKPIRFVKGDSLEIDPVAFLFFRT